MPQNAPASHEFNEAVEQQSNRQEQRHGSTADVAVTGRTCSFLARFLLSTLGKEKVHEGKHIPAEEANWGLKN